MQWHLFHVVASLLTEASDLANTLKSGKMATSVRIVQEDVVGPSLGQEAIRSGRSLHIALVLLMVYMCVMYGMMPGLVVDVAIPQLLLHTRYPSFTDTYSRSWYRWYGTDLSDGRGCQRDHL